MPVRQDLHPGTTTWLAIAPARAGLAMLTLEDIAAQRSLAEQQGPVEQNGC